MEMKLRKLWPLIGALCLGLMSSATAQNNYQSGTSSNIDSSLEQETYQRGTFREITPCAGPRVVHGADVFVDASLIWWKASEGKIPFSISGLNLKKPADETDAELYSSPERGKEVFTGGRWSPGFKVGLGLNLGHDGWDLYSQYTWLHSNHTISHEENAVALTDRFFFLPPMTDHYAIENGSIENTSRSNLHFNAIDLELGRNFYLSQFFTTRPYVGLKGTWQKHTWDMTASAEELIVRTAKEQPVIINGAISSHKHYDVWGLGIRNGLNMGWHLSKSFSFYGDVALSALWTNCYKYVETAKLENKEKNLHRGLVDIYNHEADLDCRPVMELGAGFRWDTWFSDDTYHFGAQLGWEQQNWANWSQFRALFSSNDFSVQGGTLKFRFDF